MEFIEIKNHDGLERKSSCWDAHSVTGRKVHWYSQFALVSVIAS
jgi:hypothetical protein